MSNVMWNVMCLMFLHFSGFFFPSKFQIIFVASTRRCRYKYSNSCLDRTIKSVVCWTLSSNKSQENCSCFRSTNRNPAKSFLSWAAVWSSYWDSDNIQQTLISPCCTLYRRVLYLRALTSTITLSSVTFFYFYCIPLSIIELVETRSAHLWALTIVNDGVARDGHDGHETSIFLFLKFAK
jgi:hypothetical protein